MGSGHGPLSFIMQRIQWNLILGLMLAGLISRAQTGPYQFSQLNISNGLSHNQVNTIFQDNKGFIWFGTMSGLNRYDGYTFKVFKHSLRDTSSLNDDNVTGIKEGPFGKLWVQSRSGYVIYDPTEEKFDRHPERFLKSVGIKGRVADISKAGNGGFWFATNYGIFYLSPEKGKAVWVLKSVAGLHITAVAVNSQGNIWFVYNNGQVGFLHRRTFRVMYRQLTFRSSEFADYKAFVDDENDVWLYSTDRPNGLYHISASLKSRTLLSKAGRSNALNTNNIYGLSQDSKGVIWIGTDHGGINLLDKKNGKISYLLNREGDEKSLAQNSTLVIYRDRSGIMWVGTFKRGVSYYKESIIKFPVYRHRPSDPASLSYDDVNRFAEDRKGNLWIGTNGGGLLYFDRQKNTYTQYRHEPNNTNSLSNDVVVSLWIDHEQKLWIGTYFGGLDCLYNGRFIHYKHNENDPKSISDDRIWEIFEDSEQNLWIGTLAGGLNVLDRRNGNFRHLNVKNGRLSSNYIAALIEDKAKNLWIGTDNGISVKSRSGRLLFFRHHEEDEHSLSNNNVISLCEDSRGLIWIGTQEGLNIYDPLHHRFQVWRVADGLPDNTILTILEDENHQMWISTPNGLSHIRVARKYGRLQLLFANYDEQDGLQGREFNENAAYKTRRGELIFGGANGFNLFQPTSIISNRQSPAIVLTDFQLFNKSVQPGLPIEKNLVLENSISETKEIWLRYDQNVFSIEFAALNYSNPGKNKYQYILEGFNDKWLATDGKNRKATFTNLDPGEYLFRVRASNDNDIWNNEGLTLRITILPPWWKTPVAYILYIVLGFGILFYIRRRGIANLRMQFALEQERQESRRMHELDMLKIRFFTNISHEFRTPLSLILSPLDRLVRDSTGNERGHLQLIQRNARRLLNLVNQLMDFRKMEVNELKLQPEVGDLVAFIREGFDSFTDLAEKKNIKFVFKSEVSSLIAEFDHDKIERILFNLLGNAFKFTPDGGCVSLELELKRASTNEKLLKILISDTGIGIPPEKREKVFERFFQHDLPGSMLNQGSGIGLAITKEFVSLHGGVIGVESEPGKGSVFIIEMLVKSSEIIGKRIILEKQQESDGEGVVSGKTVRDKPGRLGKKSTVLIIEDNEDFRFYLKDNLREYYTLVEAADGKSGWSKALSEHPDLIVSDIVMPEMNGIDLCMKIRNDKRTGHIPVILLTAMTGEEQLLRGLETGANDYMTKPFNFEVLLSKIRNLLNQQESLRKTYQKQIEALPSAVSIVSADEKFIQQALCIVEKNISNSEFSVEELSREMCMSRVALYKKLLQLTRQTPVEFIRNIRLKRAVQLLEQSQYNISEIAYEVGFNSPRNFARYFKIEYGVLPSMWGKQKENDGRDRVHL